MEEEKVVSGENKDLDAASYIEALNKIKSSTVDKNLYEKVVEENKTLTNALANGEYSSQPEVVEGPTLQDLEKRIMKGKSNLEIITASLEHRKKVLEETGMDEYACGTTSRKGYNPSADQLYQAELIANQLTDMVDSCDGDKDLFDTLLQKNSR